MTTPKTTPKTPNKNKRNLLLIFGILIMALIVLFVVVNYNSVGTVPSSSCEANKGFVCSTSPTYSNETGSILVAVAQNTGQTWYSANFVFVPQGTPINSTGIPEISFNSYPANTTYSANELVSEQTIVTLHLPVRGVAAPVKMGTLATGELWVEYTTSINGTPQYVQMATLNIKAS